MTDLRAVVVIDYQNVHLTGHGFFEVSKYGPHTSEPGSSSESVGTRPTTREARGSTVP